MIGDQALCVVASHLSGPRRSSLVVTLSEVSRLYIGRMVDLKMLRRLSVTTVSPQ